MEKRKTKLLFFSPNKVDYSEVGKVPSVIFYSTDQLKQDPDFIFSVSWKRNNLLRILFKPFEQYCIHRAHVGFRFDQALFHLSLLKKQDVIFAETDSCGLPLLLLKRLHLIQARIGFNSAGLINNLENQQGTRFFRFYKWLLLSADFIVCWSPLEEQMYKDLIGAKSRFVLLEADTDFYQPDFSVPPEDFILCVGNDLGRDFETLFRAVETLDIPVKVVTKAVRIKGLSIPKNVELHLEFVGYSTLLDWYKRAQLVIVNPQEIHRFTGQRALLEALAMGKAIIAASVQSLTSTYSLTDGKDIIYYQPRDIEDLKTKIMAIYDDHDKLRDLGMNARSYAEHLPKNSFYLGLRELLK